MCHKWPRICSTCHKHFLVLSSFATYYRVCNLINTTGVTSGAGTATLPEHMSSPPIFSGVRVTRSLDLCVNFVDSRLSFCIFSFDHCVVCSTSIYGFWLPLWYLQTLLVLYDYLNTARKMIFARYLMIVLVDTGHFDRTHICLSCQSWSSIWINLSLQTAHP